MTLGLEEYGFVEKLFEIDSIQIEADMTLVFRLEEKTRGAFADTLTLPPLHDRDLAITDARTVPDVTDLAVTNRAEVHQDGTTIISLIITWAKRAIVLTEIQIRRGSDVVDSFSGRGGRHEYPGVLAGQVYGIRGRHVNRHGVQGEWTDWIDFTVGGDLTVPEKPTNVQARGWPGGWNVRFDPATANDYDVSEIWTAAMSETDVANATKLVEGRGSSHGEPGEVAAGNRAIWVRHRDRSGNLGPWSDRVTVTYAAPVTMGLDGQDGIGREWIYTSSTDGAAITAAGDLPLASWDFDDIPAAGLTRGAHTYYDGTPDVSATRPYVIAFWRGIVGNPAPGTEVGDINWVQGRAVLSWGQAGQDGEEGREVEYIFTATTNGAAITGAANLPLASQNFDVDALRSSSGLQRGSQAYFDGTPRNLGAYRPYMHRFRRRVPGGAARNGDIGDQAWTQERGVQTGERLFLAGEDGAEAGGPRVCVHVEIRQCPDRWRRQPASCVLGGNHRLAHPWRLYLLRRHAAGSVALEALHRPLLALRRHGQRLDPERPGPRRPHQRRANRNPGATGSRGGHPDIRNTDSKPSMDG